MERQYYKEYYELERKHWWFKARLNILETLLKKHKPNKNQYAILNAGAATGATSVMLKSHGVVTSLEYDKECSAFLADVLKEKVINASLTELPFENESYDLVCAFDVIEHIEDDDLALKEINRVLKNNGIVYITVPAFQTLWGEHDVVNHHFRRYRMKQLTSLLLKNGFEITYKSYFNAFLFIPVLIFRKLSNFLNIFKKKKEQTHSDFENFKSGSFLNKLLYKIFFSEAFFLKNNIGFPFGVSAVIIGIKK